MSLDGGMELKRAEWRQKALDGSITEDEMREWIKLVRAGRVSAAQTSARSRERKAPISLDSMMDEIDKL